MNLYYADCPMSLEFGRLGKSKEYYIGSFGGNGTVTEAMQTAEGVRGGRTVNNLTAFVTLMGAISVATERVVEILKGMIPPLAKDLQGNAEGFRRAIMQILAGVVGAVIAYFAQPEIASTMPSLSSDKIGWVGYAIVGLLASGGSGLWNHVLDIVQAMKVSKETAIPEAARP
jgi:hypothetical protein